MRGLNVLFLLITLISLVAGHTATPRRRASDTCANVDLRLKVLLASVDVQVCACIGQLDAVITSNSAISGAVGSLGGLGNVRAMITTAIGRGNGKCSCSYPDHAIPACTKTDLCDFKCPGNASARPASMSVTANVPLSLVPLNVQPLLPGHVPHAPICVLSTGGTNGVGITARPTGHDVL
ncbi:hypothetical protein FRC07_007919 [Ceratobasidium sp. 392]|nr:hypothetical protein FRC07_007919 [Ceratobasidium sp. 392]